MRISGMVLPTALVIDMLESRRLIHFGGTQLASCGLIALVHPHRYHDPNTLRDIRFRRSQQRPFPCGTKESSVGF